MVSIICTNYNKGDWVGEAIESFLVQKTNFAFEIILVDDKSTDHSTDIIRKYAKKNPKLIRAFYNKKNLGITKTWIKICKEARGKYIARCDGDDYWTNANKLQMQVDALKKAKNSKWCSTDYDVINSKGESTHKAAVETGFINLPTTYAEMLVTKGMTMASTWLVETKLMQDINSMIDKDAVDDTFNIQLELFYHTKLTYLATPTTVYRMSNSSDSRPNDMHKRSEMLLKTQLEYVNKYKDFQHEAMLKLLLAQGVDYDDRYYLISQQKVHIQNLEVHIQNLEDIIRQKDKEIMQILHSNRYRAGRILLSPAVLVRRFKNKVILKSK